jgi:hypothetical protein
MALIMPWRIAAIPLTIAMRHAPIARKRPSICEICQYKSEPDDYDECKRTQDTTAPILKFVARSLIILFID